MNKVLRSIEVLLILLGLAAISVFVFLLKPDWSPFQPTFGANVIPVATMVAAWTALLVAYAAFKTIRNINEQEKRNRKERLLKEIIEWATQILICGRDIDVEKFTSAATERAKLIEFRQKFNIITWRGVYIRNIAEDIDQQIYRSILIAITKINQHIKVLDLRWYGKLKDNAAIGRHRSRLDDCAKLIIEIAVKLLSNKSKSTY